MKITAMKKPALTVLLLLVLGLTLICAGCGDIAAQLTAGDETEAGAAAGGDEDADAEGTEEGAEAPADLVPLALITEAAGVEEAGYDAAAWAGLSAYAEESGLAAAWYPAETADQAGRLAAVGQAVENGAQLIVCAGVQYGDTVYEAQFLYPEVSFVLCDGEPHSLDYTEFEVAPNTYAVTYTERETGYLAGYALVAEGFTKVGFLGGMALPAAVNSGAGFLQGVNQAAEDLEKNVDLYFTYTGLLGDDSSAQNLAGSWYANGVEAIYVSGDFAASVCGAAEAAGAWVIASGYDQWQLSDRVLASTVKDVQSTVQQAAAAWAEGSLWGGKQVTLGLSNSAVKLAMDNKRFANFSVANLRMLLNRLDSGELTVAPGSADTDPAALVGPRVTLHLE
ncbi:MAG: BMP family ABC transporter substrate-binding protein [Firmicutes bacterium]|nr:BMP family ABC transporter substrate-binding protein [Bacillota bacterium]